MIWGGGYLLGETMPEGPSHRPTRAIIHAEQRPGGLGLRSVFATSSRAGCCPDQYGRQYQAVEAVAQYPKVTACKPST
jgi:hypothetical protein